jgi:hypothetical protein
MRPSLDRGAPLVNVPRLPRGDTDIMRCGDAAHALQSLHQRRRRPGVHVSMAQLPKHALAPRVDPAIPAESEAVISPGRNAPHANLGH